MINRHGLYHYLFLISLIISLQQVYAQQNENPLIGNVSYITSQNIYVKFVNTSGIENGDTLFVLRENESVPVLQVKQLSSISCLCEPISAIRLNVGHEVFAQRKRTISDESIDLPPEVAVEKDVSEQVIEETIKKEEPVKKAGQSLKGRISVASYSILSNTESDDSHRLRYTLSMDAKNISSSKVSAETYISFTHKSGEWELVQENLNYAMKIYSLALRYEFTPTANLWIGRKINPKVANIGPVDGIQFQKEWKSFYTGIIAGTRPDYADFGFNPDLPQFGAYIEHYTKTENGYAQSSLALFEQRNKSKTDRRFAYFQHSNVLLPGVTFFSSFELDLYKLENGEPASSLSLTSFYLSLRYRISPNLSLSGSYDNRKNVIYYETFRNLTDEILKQAARQGLRARIMYRPVKNLNLGLSGGTRNRKGDPRPTNTLQAHTTYSKLPALDASLTLSANLTQTSYLDGQVYGARLSKDWINGKLYTVLNYRQVFFDYVNSGTKINQQIGEIDLAYRFSKKLYLSANFETTFQNKTTYNRIYLQLRKRF